MPLRYSPKSLYELSVCVLVKNTEQEATERILKCKGRTNSYGGNLWDEDGHDGTALCRKCSKVNLGIQPICLPARICHDILMACVQKAELCKISPWDNNIGIWSYQMYVFLHKYSEDVSLTFRGLGVLNERSIFDIFELIINRCVNLKQFSLKVLNYCNIIHITQLIDLLDKFFNKCGTHLEEVNLQIATKIGDHIMQILSDTTPNLKRLVLKCCSEISQETIESFCGQDESKGCTLLEYLDIGTAKISAPSLATILKGLENLTRFSTDSSVNFLTALQFCDEDSAKLQLSELELPIGTTEDLGISKINQLFENLSDLEIEFVHDWQITEVENLQLIKNLDRLALDFHNLLSAPFSVLLPTLQIMGKNLKSLLIFDIDSVDISAIITFCCNLEVLSVQSRKSPLGINSNYVNQINSKSGAKLKELELMGWNPWEFISSNVIEKILVNATELERLNLFMISALKKEVIQNVIKVNRFQKLEHLTITYCENFCKESLNYFLFLNNPLKYISVCGSSISNEDVDEIKRYLKEQNFNIKMDMAFMTVTMSHVNI